MYVLLIKLPVSYQLINQFDMTTLSSLNRHACATLEDVGSPKVIAMQKFFKKVAPWAQYVALIFDRLVSFS